jgi:para-aminobenzoate synthetase/4-amino-4-deoxychorismate lyase
MRASQATARFDDLVTGTALRLERQRGALVASATGEVLPTLAAVDEATRRGLWAAGFVSYDAAPGLDSSLVVPGSPARAGVAAPLAWFGLFEHCASAAVVGEDEPDEDAEPLAWALGTSYSSYRAKVRAVRSAIEKGLTYQCNLTERFRAPFSGDPEVLYRHLALAQRAKYCAYVDTGTTAVASASPELFFEWRADGTVVARPMKGTAPRGRWPAEDQAAAAWLAASPKDRAENVMIVDLLRNDIGRIARTGSVEVPALFDLERFETVWQLTSTVTGALRPGTGLAEIFAALFPSGSVTGAPKQATMGLIARHEPSARGVYCGAIGLVSPPGAPGPVRARFNVAIRTAVVDRRSGTIEYGAGGGVTWSSGARAEWGELHAKARLLTALTHPFRLLETMAYDPDRRGGPGGPGLGGLRSVDAHLARLASSAAYFGFSYDYERVVAALEAALVGVDRPRRARLLLDRRGEPSVSLGEMPSVSAVTLAVDDEPVGTDGPWLFHKTTIRQPYELRARRHPGADDVVLVNEQGQVTETTIANLAVRLSGRWYTPPIGAGCLPGIERGRLVAAGALAERAISVSELLSAEAVAVVSSLRGWRPASVAREQCVTRC